jgi:hypothetical protein
MRQNREPRSLEEEQKQTQKEGEDRLPPARGAKKQ